MRVFGVFSAFALTGLLDACCGVGAHGAPVRFTGQTNVVVWDAAHRVEHFVRDARFETKGTSLGFIAPTPGKPTLSAADPGAFDLLEGLTPPETVPASRTKEATGAAGAVEVVETTDVAGYRATVLKATDGAALGAWLKANGYPSPSFLPKWSEPYVRRGWYLTAFKVNGEATGPVRMSFETDRPFNPYAVPEENGVPGATLRLYYVSAGGEVPKVGGNAEWVAPKWTADLPEEKASLLATQLKLAEGALPPNAKVTLYEDGAFGRPGFDDLYFVPDDGLRRTLALGGAAAGGAAVLLAVALRRRRRPTLVHAS